MILSIALLIIGALLMLWPSYKAYYDVWERYPKYSSFYYITGIVVFCVGCFVLLYNIVKLINF